MLGITKPLKLSASFLWFRSKNGGLTLKQNIVTFLLLVPTLLTFASSTKFLVLSPHNARLPSICVHFSLSTAWSQNVSSTLPNTSNILWTRLTALGSMFTMINRSVRNVLIYNRENDFDLNEEIFEKYITKSLILAILWSFSGDWKLKFRIDLGDFIRAFASIQLPNANSPSPIIDFEVVLETGEWTS